MPDSTTQAVADAIAALPADADEATMRRTVTATIEALNIAARPAEPTEVGTVVRDAGGSIYLLVDPAVEKGWRLISSLMPVPFNWVQICRHGTPSVLRPVPTAPKPDAPVLETLSWSWPMQPGARPNRGQTNLVTLYGALGATRAGRISILVGPQLAELDACTARAIAAVLLDQADIADRMTAAAEAVTADA
jgi:hypothetical protein